MRRELVGHDQADANMGFGGGGRGRPDALRGARECAGPRVRIVSDCFSTFCCTSAIFCLRLALDGAEAVGEARFKFVKAAPLIECVPCEGLADLMTGVSRARVGRGGWIPMFNVSGVHQSFAHGVAKPGAKIVGVAHSSTDPSLARCGQ
jgi:hypothetical protein